MKTIPRYFIFPTILMTVFACDSAKAATLVQYGFDAVDGTAGTSAATVIATGLSATDAANNNAGNTLGSSPLGFFSASTFTGNNANGTGITVGTGGSSGVGTGSGNVLNFRANGGQTLAEATATVGGIPTSGEYFGFTVSGAGGNTLDLSTISFDFAKGGTSNDRGVVVWYSTDGFTSNAAVLGNGSENSAVILAANTDLLARNVSFSLASLPDTTSSIEFRFISTNNSGNTIKLDNITIAGTVVPEPSALFLSTLGILGLLRRRR